MMKTEAHYEGRNGDLAVRVRKTYRERRAIVFTLDADFAVSPGVTILFGASGAGKTTLLQCIAGLATPETGRIACGEEIWFDAETRIRRDPAERKLGFVFQDLALFPHLTAEENISYGLRRMDAGERAVRVDRVLQSLRIGHLRRRKPREISGGEQQRVALARSLVTEPRALLLDEPLASLDAEVKAGIVDDLRAWNAARGIPILYVTHDREEAFALGTRMILLESGRIAAQGAPADVLDAPRRETVARLAGFENIFDAEITAAHEANGTMTCRLRADEARPALLSNVLPGTPSDAASSMALEAWDNSRAMSRPVALEVPLTRVPAGQSIRVAIRAGDILLAGIRPEKLSARNVLPGHVEEIVRTGARVAVRVNCGGVCFLAHVTPAAVESLNLRVNCETWLIVKSYSCHLVGSAGALG
jgi:molybdate transport system ATP-binding protein